MENAADIVRVVRARSDIPLLYTRCQDRNDRRFLARSEESKKERGRSAPPNVTRYETGCQGRNFRNDKMLPRLASRNRSTLMNAAGALLVAAFHQKDARDIVMAAQVRDRIFIRPTSVRSEERRRVTPEEPRGRCYRRCIVMTDRG